MKMIPVILCVFFTSCQFNRNDAYISSISSLPSFPVLLLDSTTLIDPHTNSINKPILLIYFRPDCPHCKRETSWIINSPEMLKGYQIYFITGYSIQEALNYSKMFHLNQYHNIFIGKDFNHSFKSIFKPSAIPFIAIYNSQRQLAKIYTGEVTVTSLITAIHS